jgi:hypothetical protein
VLCSSQARRYSQAKAIYKQGEAQQAPTLVA